MIGAALTGGQQLMGHQAEKQAVAGRNRAKLRNYEREQLQYKTDAMFNNAQYRNDIQVTDIKQDEIYRSMVDQWTEQDRQLDALFADADMKLEEGIREMYENEYAGTQTGATAARLAGKSAKKLGFEKAANLQKLMTAEEDVAISKDKSKRKATAESWDLYEQVNQAPMHGERPLAPELDAPPSSASLLLGLGQTGFQGYKDFKASGAPNIFSKKKDK